MSYRIATITLSDEIRINTARSSQLLSSHSRHHQFLKGASNSKHQNHQIRVRSNFPI